MEVFRSMHLQKHLGKVQAAVRREPVLFVNHDQPSAVMMSAAEFTRLKQAAGEDIPAELSVRQGVSRHGLPPDPLGYDLSDFEAAALRMAAEVASGRNRVAVEAEIERVERRLHR